MNDANAEATARDDMTGLRALLFSTMREVRAGTLDVHQAKSIIDSGALGAGISGSGPSVFAWCEGRLAAERAGEAMRRAFADAGHASDVFVSRLPGPRAERIA